MEAIKRIGEKMHEALQSPIQFSDLMDLFDDEEYRNILLAWGELREKGLLSRTPDGRYFIEK